MSNPFATTDQVNAVIKVRRGPESDREQTIFEDGELSYSTDKKRMFIGDNLTNGGILVGNKVWYVDSFDKVPYIEGNDIVYRTDLNAFYLFYGNNPLLSSSYVLVGGKKLINDNVDLTVYTLPNATKTIKGGVIIGNGLSANNGILTIDYDPNVFVLDSANKLTLKNATALTLNDATYISKGIVQINDGTSNSRGGLSVDNGVLSVKIDDNTLKLNTTNNTLYVDPLPSTVAATRTTLGSIIIGKGLSASTLGKVDVLVDNNTIKIDGANQLYVDTSVVGGGGGGTTFTLNDGTSDLIGINKLTVGEGLSLDNSGLISLPIAAAALLGGVKVGTNGGINKSAGGVISVGVDDTSIRINGSNQLTLDPRALSAVFQNSQSQNGYVQIAGDIALMWGKASFTGGATATVTFPAQFASTCYIVLATHTGATGTPVAIRTSGISSSGATLNISTGATMDCFWFAVGDS